MTRIVSSKSATRTFVVGYGIRLSEDFRLAPGLTLLSDLPEFSLDDLAKGTEHFADYASCVLMKEIGSFTLRVEGSEPGEPMAVKTWNSLWSFSLLTIACSTHCIPLFTKSAGLFSVSNRNRFISPRFDVVEPSVEDLEWASANFDRFGALIDDQNFSRAIRYLTNSHYLDDVDARIMLLWAGIECLLGVESELRNRIGLYAAILHDGTAQEKLAHQKAVRDAYTLRSKVVHGRGKSDTALITGYSLATSILSRLLRKCVELGRVPSTAELDAAAAGGSLS